MNDTESVEAVNAEFYAAFEAADLDRMRAVWMDDDTASCVHPGWRVLHGTSRIMRSWAVIFANTPYIQFFLNDVDVTVLGDVAVVRCIESILTSLTDTGGDASVAATNVFLRHEDGWRLWLHHGSPVVQPAEADGLG
ncbi:MAG TPA: nuclear transport factor 2 family protein [Mycobacteriales bacterium]|nr:nuclear transport factor 2 family protein [Mycobacteriales bacterium]